MYLQETKKRIIEFIWNGKPPKVKYNTLTNNIEDRGLSLQDIECKLKAIKIKWIQNIGNEKFTAPWKSYLNTKFNRNINQIPEYNYTESDYPHFTDNFYNELFKTWANLHHSIPKNAEETSQQPLWNNAHIKANNRCIEFTKWKNIY